MRSIRGLYVIRSAGSPATLGRSTVVREEPTAVAEDGRLGTLEVDFSRFGAWYEIDSWWEGRFLERVVRGAFAKTIAERGDQVKVLFNHGFDLNIGDKILGVPEVLEERPAAPHLEAGLLDTSYNRDLEPGLRAGGYGSSFMFEVLGERWDREPDKSDHNPDGLPERSLTEVRLFEAGPVTWPANPEATAGLRSMSGTDWLVDQLQARDRDRREDLLLSLARFRARHGLRTPDEGAATPNPTPTLPTPAPAGRHVEGTPHARAARLRAVHLDALRRRTDEYAYSGGDPRAAGGDPARDGGHQH